MEAWQPLKALRPVDSAGGLAGGHPGERSVEGEKAVALLSPILQKIYGQLRLLPSLRTSYPGLRTTPDGAASR